MIIVTQADITKNNADYTCVFDTPIILSPHSRIALLKAQIPLTLIDFYTAFFIDTRFDYINYQTKQSQSQNKNKFTIEVFDDNPTTPTLSYTTITLPVSPYSYTISDFVDLVNKELVNVDFNFNGGTPVLATFSWDPIINRFKFNFKQRQTSTIDEPIFIRLVQNDPINNYPAAEYWGMMSGFTEGILGSNPPPIPPNPLPSPAPTPPSDILSVGSCMVTESEGGEIVAVNPPFNLRKLFTEYLGRSVQFHVSISTFQVSTANSTGFSTDLNPPAFAERLQNNKSIVHTITAKIDSDYINYCFNNFTQLSDFNRYNGNDPDNVPFKTAYLLDYEPKNKHYVEINNDTITYITGMNIQLINVFGAINDDNGVSIPITDDPYLSGSVTTTIVFEVETEPEKSQEALRAVKDKIRFERFLKNHQFDLPL